MSRFIVYALTDPRDGQVRYIGLSSSGLTRPRTHKDPGRLKRDPGDKADWISGLKEFGLTYGIVVLCALPSAEHLPAAEVFWIAEGRRRGWPLTNRSTGGAMGALGCKRSPEHIARIKEYQRSRLRGPLSEEHRAKIAARSKGHVKTPQERARRSAALMGNKNGQGKKRSAESIAATVAAHLGSKRSPETRAKIAAKALGRKMSPETRAKMSAAHTGRTASPETRARISSALKGHPVSDEARANMSAAQQRRIRGGK